MFVTFFMARSGSKYLRSLLNQHPDIHDFGEVFHDREKSFGDEHAVLNKFADIVLSSEPLSGFQFRYPRHVKEFPEIFNLIERNKTIKMILLRRRNKLKGAISQQNSEKLKAVTGKAHLFKNSSESMGCLNLDVPRAIKEALHREELDEYYKAWAGQHFETIEIFYEDLCKNPELEVNRICKFLGCSPFKPGLLKESELVKVTSDNIADAINNYEELTNSLEEVNKLEWVSNIDLLTDGAGSKKKTNFVLVERAAQKGKIINYEGFTFSGKKIKLAVDMLYVKTHARFLEWVGGKLLVVSQGDLLRFSRDDGNSWSELATPITYEKCFTTANDTHLLQANDGLIYRYDNNWKLVGTIKTGDYPWHGSWSIDQNPDSGTILWCEYPYSAETVNVWRSTDDGISWSKCFTQNGHATEPKLGDVRHFHLVQKCTSVRGRWYLSSGDTERQSKLWVSEDDGESWEVVPINKVIGATKGIPSSLYGRLHRFTSIVQTNNKIIWVTDDTFKGLGARMCVVDKDRLDVIRVVDGNCGKNEIRNLIKVDERHAFAVSESKIDMDTASLVLIDYLDEKIEWTGLLKNERGVKANFMNGLSALSAVGNKFYARSDNKVIFPAPMTLRWTLDIT